MKKILLVLIGISVFALADMSRDNATDVVTDSCTALDWQDDVIKSGTSWIDAIDYCENLMLNNGGWRLPNINELMSIVDYESYRPSINSTIFQNTAINAAYWSSTTWDLWQNQAWYIGFVDGVSDSTGKTGGFSVRCVRSH